MQNFTPAQIQAIQGWTGQRDTLLREIGVHSLERDELVKGNQALGLSNADLEKQIAEKRGRIAELDALEIRHRGSVATDIAELEVRKSRLEVECLLKEAELKAAFEKQVIVTAATGDLKSAHDTMKDQAVIVNRVVGEVIETSQLHTSEMKVVMAEIKAISDEVIAKGNENIAQTGIILEKLPRYIFELQKPIPIRRVYAAPEGMEIAPSDAVAESKP